MGPYGRLLTGTLAILLGGAYAQASWRINPAAAGSGWAPQTASVELRYGIVIAGSTLLFQLGFHPFGG